MSEAHKRKIGESVSKVRTGKPLSKDHRLALIGSHMNRKRVLCTHCGKDYAVNTIKRHEKSCKINGEFLIVREKDGHEVRGNQKD